MQILNSGSFVNADNQEKIEQLKFTAEQIANATAEKQEVAGGEEAWKKLGLEFWNGLEYMCRDAEEAAIKNIFLNHFLDRLRELQNHESSPVSELSDDSKTNDEFLGIIAETPPEDEDEETIIAEEAQAIMEEDSRLTSDFQSSDEIFAGSEKSETPVSVSSDANESSETLAEEQREMGEEMDASEKSPEKSVPEILHLPEKEPYNFARCTVTATVQLLPASGEGSNRKAVVSVRTHEFAPQIQMVEISAENSLATKLASELERVFEKYKSDLPLKVMDKLKSEKNKRKNRTKTKSNSPVETARSESIGENAAQTLKTSAEETETKESVSPTVAAASTQTAQTGAAVQQGSLF